MSSPVVDPPPSVASTEDTQVEKAHHFSRQFFVLSAAPLDVLRDPGHEVSHVRVEARQSGPSTSYPTRERKREKERDRLSRGQKGSAEAAR